VRLASVVAVCMALHGGVYDAAAQEAPRLAVKVRQVAGASIYLDVGTRHGVAPGDTLQVAADSTGGSMGWVVVTAATEVRSVLTFAGEPFPVARGTPLTLLLLREPAERPAEAPAPQRVATIPAGSGGGAGTTVPEVRRLTPPASSSAPHGRVALDVSAVRSLTQVGGVDPLEIERTFATPSLRFDVTAPRAVAGFTLRTSARVGYRYSSENSVQPATSARIYAASLERDFTALPLYVSLGRFHSRHESYSGFWDGALVRLGGDGLGVGAIVGFEPELWNERPSAQRPKATAFVDGRARGAGWRWMGDFSAHTVRPRDSLPPHTFMGASQRLTAGPLLLSEDVQIDRDPTDGRWRVSRLRLRAVLELIAGLELRGGLARRETYVAERFESPFGARRDRVDGGIGLRMDGGYASVDMDLGKDAAGRETRGTSAFFSVRSLPGIGFVGLVGSASRWSGEYGSTVTAAPGFIVDLDPLSLRMGYRYGRSDYLERVVRTHGVDASVDAPLGSGMRVSARARLQWGGTLESRGLDLTLYRIF
jgi:hypothetical protein